eukprot:scaffold54737_cov66-Phaeocystis_antarctica.AAC.2
MDARRSPCDELRHLPVVVIDRVPALMLVRRVAQQGIAKLPEAARCAWPPLAGPRPEAHPADLGGRRASAATATAAAAAAATAAVRGEHERKERRVKLSPAAVGGGGGAGGGGRYEALAVACQPKLLKYERLAERRRHPRVLEHVRGGLGDRRMQRLGACRSGRGLVPG